MDRLKLNQTGTSAAFSAQSGHIYEFRSRARDNAGNVEEYINADSTTAVETMDLWVNALEVVQSVQDLNHSVILIERKRTFVWCYPDTNSPSGVAGVKARLKVYVGASGSYGYFYPINAGRYCDGYRLPDSRRYGVLDTVRGTGDLYVSGDERI